MVFVSNWNAYIYVYFKHLLIAYVQYLCKIMAMELSGTDIQYISTVKTQHMQGPDVHYNWVIPGYMFRLLNGYLQANI